MTKGLVTVESASYCHDLLMRIQAKENESRKEAEKELNHLASSEPDLLALSLIHISSFGTLELKSYAGLIFKRLFILPVKELVCSETDPVRFNTLTLDTRCQIKRTLIELLYSETAAKVRNNLCEVVSALYVNLETSQAHWHELAETTLKLCHENNQLLCESGFRIITAYPDIIPDNQTHSVGEVLISLPHNSGVSLLLAAFKATLSLLTFAETEREHYFAVILPQVFNYLEIFSSEHHEFVLSEAIFVLLELIEHKPEVLISHLTSLLQFGFSIMNTASFEDSTRQMGFELVLSLIESSGFKYEDLSEFCSVLLPVVLLWTSNFEEEEEWYTTTDLTVNDESTFQSVGETGLSRLSYALGGKPFMLKAFSLIEKMAVSEHWQERYAAVLTISTISEGCFDSLKKEMPHIVGLILQFLSDPHPRVRHSCLYSISQLSTYFPEEFGLKYYDQILLAILPVLEDCSCTRVQAQACGSLTVLVENLDQILLEPIMFGLVSKLVALLNTNVTYLQEKILVAIASLAECTEDGFIKYYDEVMAILIQFMKLSTQPTLQKLRAKAIECSSYVILAVGYDHFIPSLDSYTQLLLEIQNTTLKQDLIQSHVQQAWTRLAIVLGKLFSPFASLVIPGIMAKSKLKPSLVLLDNDNLSEGKYSAIDGWEFQESHGQQVGYRSSEMDDICTAIEMLICFSDTLQAEFASFAQELIPNFLMYFNFYFHPGLRSAAIRSIPSLIWCLVDAGAGAGADYSVINELYETIFATQIRQLRIEKDAEFLNLVLDSFHKVLENIGSNILTNEQVEKFTQVLLPKLESAILKLDVYSKSCDAPGFSEEADPEVLEEAVYHEDFINSFSYVFHTIIRLHGSAFFTELRPIISLANSSFHNRNSHVRQWAVGVFDDLVEHGGQDTSTFFNGCFCDSTIDLLFDPSPDVRQASAYGIGLWAKVGGAEYASYCNKALSSLFKAIQASSTNIKEDMKARDNFISSIAKILEYKSNFVENFEEDFILWLSYLPIVTDLDEVSGIYDYLLKLADGQFPLLVGSSEATIRFFILLIKSVISNIFEDDQKSRVLSLIKYIFHNNPHKIQVNLRSIISEVESPLKKDLEHFIYSG